MNRAEEALFYTLVTTVLVFLSTMFYMFVPLVLKQWFGGIFALYCVIYFFLWLDKETRG